MFWPVARLGVAILTRVLALLASIATLLSLVICWQEAQRPLGDAAEIKQPAVQTSAASPGGLVGFLPA